MWCYCRQNPVLQHPLSLQFWRPMKWAISAKSSRWDEVWYLEERVQTTEDLLKIMHGNWQPVTLRCMCWTLRCWHAFLLTMPVVALSVLYFVIRWRGRYGFLHQSHIGPDVSAYYIKEGMQWFIISTSSSTAVLYLNGITRVFITWWGRSVHHPCDGPLPM